MPELIAFPCGVAGTREGQQRKKAGKEREESKEDMRYER